MKDNTLMNKNQLLYNLNYYASILEKHFHSVQEIHFTVCKDEFFILSTNDALCSDIGYLRILIDMFCEEILSLEELIPKLSFNLIEKMIDAEQVLEPHEMTILIKGHEISRGIGIGKICYEAREADHCIEEGINYILFLKLFPQKDRLDLIANKYCQGVIGTSYDRHILLACIQAKKPYVIVSVNYLDLKDKISKHTTDVTIDGNSGLIYAGNDGEIKECKYLEEIKILYRLLTIIIKKNIITGKTIPLIWRLWDIILLKRLYRNHFNDKRMVEKHNSTFIRVGSLSEIELNELIKNLQTSENASLLADGLIYFLFSELSANVQIGKHFLYMRPLFDPMETVKLGKDGNNVYRLSQLTGLEFFHLNRYVDYLIDIYSIKIYFLTECHIPKWSAEEKDYDNLLNYLDFTNPYGESIIINNYNAKSILVYINDVLIPEAKLPYVYHFLRRRKYYFSWFADNEITRDEIIRYLNHGVTNNNQSDKVRFLCEEKQLIRNGILTPAGKSLIGKDNIMTYTNNNIDYILNEVLSRGQNDNLSDSNDYFSLLRKKEFKDLIAMEIYEYYFWEERHEYNLQLLREIVEAVYKYFTDPLVIQQLEIGLLHTLPSAIIIFWVGKIKDKIGKAENKEDEWSRIENNIKKIEKEFSNHDYFFSDDIESIFGTNREEIQPLLKLCGCRCFINKNKCLWIKYGTKEERVREILKNTKFIYK